MKIVIDIPEEEYAKVKDGRASVSMMRDAIRNGTLLPKGHGRLIDADRTIATAWTNFYKHEDEWEKKDNDYLPIGRIYDQNGFECCQQTIVNAPTIIEADKEGAEEKRFERILESASAQVPLRGKREENRPTWQQDREGGAE